MKLRDLDPCEWDFDKVPDDLESDAFQYELCRERKPVGLTLECLKERWPWVPAPWLKGWAQLDEDGKALHRRRAKVPIGIPALFRITPQSSVVRVPDGLVTFLGVTGSENDLEDDTEAEIKDGLDPDLEVTPTWSVEALGIDWGCENHEIIAAFEAWLLTRRAEIAGSLPAPEDRRQRVRARLKKLGAFRLARCLFGGSDHFKFDKEAFAKCSNFAGDRLGLQYGGRTAWDRAIGETRTALGQKRIRESG